MWHHLGRTENLFNLVRVWMDHSRAIYFFAYANTKTFLVEEFERETPLVHVTSAAAAGKKNKSENSISTTEREREKAKGCF